MHNAQLMLDSWGALCCCLLKLKWGWNEGNEPVSKSWQPISLKRGRSWNTFWVGLKPRGFMRMAGRSRMNREVHVRFCEGLGVKFPRATRLCRFKTIDLLGTADLRLWIRIENWVQIYRILPLNNHKTIRKMPNMSYTIYTFSLSSFFFRHLHLENMRN